jgi:hypothetical protein
MPAPGVAAGVAGVGVEPLSVSLFDVFSRRDDGDDVGLPRQASDAELLAWGTRLGHGLEDDRASRRTPLRAAPSGEAAHPRRRPLVADPL